MRNNGPVTVSTCRNVLNTRLNALAFWPLLDVKFATNINISPKSADEHNLESI
jgi:hypothetical protein